MEEQIRYKWPDYIIWEGRQICRARAEKNFAEYILPASQMNKKIYVTQDNLRKWYSKWESP